MAKQRVLDSDAAYRYQLGQNVQFWQRFGGRPALDGKRVLDFGCAEGGLVADMLDHGAATGAGIDISEVRVAYGNERLASAYGDRIKLYCGDIRAMGLASDFDLIVSRNVLEHVADLDTTLAAVVGLAKPGARIMFGFSPLWYSPYGSHHYPNTRLPWWHLVVGDQGVIAAHNAVARSHLENVKDMFNKCTPRDFRAAFAKLPVKDLHIRTNVAEPGVKSLAMGVFRTLAAVPPLEKYLTVGMYVTMTRV